MRVRELGYVEGQNLTISHRYAEGRQLTRIELVVNAQTARALGPTFPILARAEVID